MRLRHALPVLAGGLLLGWAALAQAAAPPPAAPIFYCPKPAAAAPAKTPSKAPAVKAHAVRHGGCPTERRVVAVEHRHYRAHRVEMRIAVAPPPPVVDRDVSASQAFIYRYERAMHGLNARAAEEAWGHPPPPCERAGRCPPVEHRVIIERHELAEAAPPPRDEYYDRAPPPVVAPPPCRERCPGHGPAPVVREHFAEVAPPPVRERFAEQAPPPAEHVYRVQGRGYVSERTESEHSSGWRYSDVDGQRHFEQWGDGDGRHDGARDGVCPRDHACGRAGRATYAAGDGQWRDGSYGEVTRYSGRDAYGYLVWPGKTPAE
ncbi:MAG TPA: hypothetical protein VGG29_20100 [Caulobacteraceae bacterium]|jgi:hypothetical protein